ncbi:hypothetical protein ON010_g18832 [Phytophthora cinnamomi]|nr:hypothetical protein ON010_g18832 [Phytophthora cinnamomi]
MARFPDPTFPHQDTGILDGRRTRTNNPKSRFAMGAPDSANEIQESRSPLLANMKKCSCEKELEQNLRELVKARTRYFIVYTIESLLHLQTAYDRGSLSGVIDAVCKTVESAILQCRSSSCRGESSDEAYAAVAARVADIRSTMQGIAAFPPEYVDPSEEPSPDFSASRIKRSHAEYCAATEKAYKSHVAAGVSMDPDQPILSPPAKNLSRRKASPRSSF